MGHYYIDPDEISTRLYTKGWGTYRVPIHTLPGTNTYGRGNFFIHCGEVLGSAGCIDVARREAELFQILQKQSSPFSGVVYYLNKVPGVNIDPNANNSIPLEVKYPGRQ